MGERIQSFEAFWPYYMGEHRDPRCRALHYLGTSMIFVLLAAAGITGRGWLILVIPVVAYGCAWIGHFVIEKNRPATFRYPLWSLRADFRMFGLFLRGKMDAELQRLQL